MATIKTSEHDTTYVIKVNGEIEMLIYRNPFNNGMWTAQSKYGSKVLKPNSNRHDLIEEAERYLKDIADFWEN